MGPPSKASAPARTPTDALPPTPLVPPCRWLTARPRGGSRGCAPHGAAGTREGVLHGCVCRVGGGAQGARAAGAAAAHLSPPHVPPTHPPTPPPPPSLQHQGRHQRELGGCQGPGQEVCVCGGGSFRVAGEQRGRAGDTPAPPTPLQHGPPTHPPTSKHPDPHLLTPTPPHTHTSSHPHLLTPTQGL